MGSPPTNISRPTTTEEEGALLSRFFSGTRLTKIPTALGKRRVVLERLVMEFEPGLRYREREINLTLEAFHADYTSLRRCLVDEGFHIVQPAERDQGTRLVRPEPHEIRIVLDSPSHNLKFLLVLAEQVRASKRVAVTIAPPHAVVSPIWRERSGRSRRQLITMIRLPTAGWRSRVRRQTRSVEIGSFAANPLTNTTRRPKKSTSTSLRAPTSGCARTMPSSATARGIPRAHVTDSASATFSLCSR